MQRGDRCMAVCVLLLVVWAVGQLGKLLWLLLPGVVVVVVLLLVLLAVQLRLPDGNELGVLL